MGDGVVVVSKVVGGSGPALVRARREEEARRRMRVVLERCIFVDWFSDSVRVG